MRGKAIRRVVRKVQCVRRVVEKSRSPVLQPRIQVGIELVDFWVLLHGLEERGAVPLAALVVGFVRRSFAFPGAIAYQSDRHYKRICQHNSTPY